MNEPGIYWVRKYATEEWSVAELRDDGWVMFGAGVAAGKDLCFAEIGDRISLLSTAA
jgi:hypothetical protein